MASKDLLVPELGASVAEGTLSRWLKKSGDVVSAGEAIAEIETDTVNLAIEAPEAGVLSDLMVSAGASVAPGTLLVTIREESSPAPETRPARAIGSTPRVASVSGIDHRQIYDEDGEFTRYAWQAIEQTILSMDAKRIAASLDQTYDFVQDTCRAVSGRR